MVVSATRAVLLATVFAGALLPARSSGDASPDLSTIDRRIYEASGALAPRHPVTGQPVLNVVPETLEIRLARDYFREYAERARREGRAVDPPGPRLDRIERVFRELVAVAHRRSLPWEVHWVEDPAANAFTVGGGLVVVASGLFDNLVRDGDEPALAAILAHEIAHVALLHPPRRVTWMKVGGAISRDPNDPYYQAAYTSEQEAEADRLSTLYLALAGYDPLAAAELWEHIHAQGEDSASRSKFLHDHPLSAERVAITRVSGHAVSRYWRRGRRNPESQEILQDNVLYPHVREGGYRPGDGVTRAAQAMLDVFRVHRRTTTARDTRRAAADDQARVRVVGTWHTETGEGDPGLAVDVWNGGARAIRTVQVTLAYWTDGDMVLIDECEHDVTIPPGAARPLVCLRQEFASDRIEPRVGEVDWH